MKPTVSAADLARIVASVKDISAIVEGARDVHSLHRLGFVRVVQIDRPIFEVCEKFSPGDTVQVLTDLDKAGKLLYSKLKYGLDRCGVRVDSRLRDALFKSEVSHIEGLARYIERNID